MSRIARLMPTVFINSGYQNGIPNGDFSNGLTGWTLFQATGSVVNGIANITPTSNNNMTNNEHLQTLVTFLASQKYYVAAYVKGSTSVRLRRSNYILGTITQGGTWQLIGMVYSYGTELSRNYGIWDGALSDWTTFQCAKIVFINLTALFGVGNEPDIAWCHEQIFPNVLY